VPAREKPAVMPMDASLITLELPNTLFDLFPIRHLG
jgi:hypothetical protein